VSQPADLRAELAALFAKVRADVDQAERQALALLDGTARPRWLSMKEAAMDHGCTIETMTRHVVRYGLGAKVGGRWQIDRQRLQEWRDQQLSKPSGPAAPDSQFDVFRGLAGSDSRFSDEGSESDQ
jgi:hypothetical protein